MSEFYYFDVEHAVRVHDFIIEKTGGLPGTKNLGGLESLLEHIQNDDYYPSFEEKITHLVFSLIKHHLFNDGNKRSSLALGAYFLRLNGFEMRSVMFIHKMENIAVWVAENVISKDFLNKLITSIIHHDDYPQELKEELFITIVAGLTQNGSLNVEQR